MSSQNSQISISYWGVILGIIIGSILLLLQFTIFAKFLEDAYFVNGVFLSNISAVFIIITIIHVIYGGLPTRIVYNGLLLGFTLTITLCTLILFGPPIPSIDELRDVWGIT